MPAASTALPDAALASLNLPLATQLPLAGSISNQNLHDLLLVGATGGHLLQQSNRSHAQGILTTHVWPKSRMLFAVVSKMSKEGVLNAKQRGVLKDLILEYDSRLVQCLQEYDRVGNKDRLYYQFLQIANLAEYASANAGN